MKKTTLLLCVLLMGIFAKATAESPKPGKIFVLVHGAWQSAFVWNQVKDDLQKKGHTVIVVNLPSHGDDNTEAAKASMDAYRDKVIASVKSTDAKVILVGHSMGGMIISAVAEQIPQQIESLVYLGAFLPNNGDSLMGLAMQDKQAILGPAIVPSQDQLTMDIKKDAIIPIFCQDADAKTQKLVLAKFKVEPAIPFGDKLTLSAAHFGNAKKYYIHTLLDQAIGIGLQNNMVSKSNVKKTFSLKAGHSPHITQPHEVSKILSEIAK